MEMCGAVTGVRTDSLAALLRRVPVAVSPETSVRDALGRMCVERVGTVVVTDPLRGLPLGILTQRDAVQRVALPAGNLDEAVAGVMTGGVVALPLDASVHQARLSLARHGLRHLVVVDDEGRFAGVLCSGDLYARGRLVTDDLIETIRAVDGPEALATAAQRLRAEAAGRVDVGEGAQQLGEWISILNDLIVQKAIELTEGEFDLPLVRWCWLGFGSEGRLEQTLSTDQDNGLVFVPERCDDTDVLRSRFLPFAQRVNALLDACGYPLCQGGVMAGNPRWCLSVDEWRGQFAEWMCAASPENLLNGTIFFDLRALAGDAALASGLLRWLLDSAADNGLFLRFMAGNALSSGLPLGRLRDFAVDRRSGLLDLKRDGSRPFVDAARILALSLRIGDTSTVGRLRATGAALGWAPRDVEAFVEAFDFIQLLRLRRQRAATRPPNQVAPAELNEMERARLKESFRQGRRLQQLLALRYQL
jgi:CBS domain-containing protein